MSDGWTTEIYGLLVHPSSNRILMVSGDSGWALPGIQTTGRPYLQPPLASPELSRLLDFPVIAYRYARIVSNEQDTHQEGVFVLEALEPIPELSDSMTWVRRDDLSGLQLRSPDHRVVIGDYLGEVGRGRVPAYRQPWERAGWFAHASRWIETMLASMGREVTGPAEQVRLWSLSCVLRTPTGDGAVYFKAAARQPLFVNEGPLLSYLGTVCPGQVPEVITSDPASGWMLLEDMGPTIQGAVPIDLKMAILTAFGGIQHATASHTDQFLALGCADRRPQTLIDHIEPLLYDESTVAALASEEVDELRRRMPELIDMCRRIEDYAVPSTLVHGDLHAGNVASRDDRLIFFDWTDAAVAHPFMDMFMIFDEEDDADRNRMLDAYLQTWTGFESMERIRELWSLCGVVHSIYHAVSYQWILRHTEARSKREMEGMLTFLLRKALRFLRDPT